MKDLSKIDQKKRAFRRLEEKYGSAFELLSKAKTDQEFYGKGKNRG